MITRFYVDNYKCLVNFEYKPKPMELIIGANGSGKTTVFEALDKVRQFITEKSNARDLFRPEFGTKWSSSALQIFEIDTEANDIKYRYRLEIDLSSREFRVEKETLWRQETKLIESIWKKLEKVDISTDDDDFDDSDPFEEHAGQTRFVVRGRSSIPLSDSNQSILSVSPRVHYANEFNKIVLFKLNPPLISNKIGKILPRLLTTGENFGSYYLYVLQQKQGRMFDVIAHLRKVLPGFDSFSVEEDFEEGRRELNVNFKSNGDSKTKRSDEIKFSFDELSDGQRSLVVLYTLVFCEVNLGTTLIIDEPENYIGLRELQPLIVLMEEQVREKGGQILLISHNQEFINMLTDRGQCVRFYRENNGHTRIAEFNPDSELTAAEIVARGWEDDE